MGLQLDYAVGLLCGILCICSVAYTAAGLIYWVLISTRAYIHAQAPTSAVPEYVAWCTTLVSHWMVVFMIHSNA